MNKLKNKSGITLIALVVTIIVLLILAGISIQMLTGDNGILNRAGEAKEMTDIAQIEERVKLAYNAAIADGKGELTEANLRTELTNEFGDDYDLSEDTTTNEWVISVNDVERLRISKGETTPVVTSKLTEAEKSALETNGIAEITGNAISNDNFKNNSRIKAVITGDVPLTTEMTYLTGTKDTGVVVAVGKTETDPGSEFVWVPVPVAIATTAPSTTGVDLVANPTTERPMAILQSGSTTNYQGILYDFSGTTSTARSIVSVTGTSGYREPAYLSSYDNTQDAYAIPNSESDNLQKQYNSIVASIAKYGGFYVGRYELGLEGDSKSPVSKPASSSVTTADASNSNTTRWYGLYSKCKSFSADNLTSTMMWGSQYDAMMNWMAKTGKTVGTADSNKYNTAKTTGNKPEDIINNVYDLYGCHLEWTLEAYSTSSRVGRGGHYYRSDSPSYRTDLSLPSDTYGGYSSRLSLYIK